MSPVGLQMHVVVKSVESHLNAALTSARKIVIELESVKMPLSRVNKLAAKTSHYVVIHALTLAMHHIRVQKRRHVHLCSQ